jgi:predicted homoserine dehydrogenase-like protein
MGGLPLGLAHDVKVLRPVKRGRSLSWADVAIDTTTRAYQLRREMEAVFGEPPSRVAADRVVQTA